MRPNKKLKKGISKELVYIVVFAAVLLLFIYFYGTFSEKITGKTPYEICKSSVALHASSHIYDLYIESELNCPTQYITIEGRKKEEVIKELAKKKYECWDMWGGRNFNLFKHEEGESKTYCAICNDFEFKYEMEIPVRDYLEYELKHGPVEGGKKYLELYTDKPASTIDIDLMLADSYGEVNESLMVINTAVPYVNVYRYSKTSYETTLTAALKGAAVGIGLSIVAVIGVVLSPLSGGATLAISVAAVGGLTAAGVAIGASGASSKVADWEASVELTPRAVASLDTFACDELPVTQKQIEE